MEFGGTATLLPRRQALNSSLSGSGVHRLGQLSSAKRRQNLYDNNDTVTRLQHDLQYLSGAGVRGQRIPTITVSKQNEQRRTTSDVSSASNSTSSAAADVDVSCAESDDVNGHRQRSLGSSSSQQSVFSTPSSRSSADQILDVEINTADLCSLADAQICSSRRSLRSTSEDAETAEGTAVGKQRKNRSESGSRSAGRRSSARNEMRFGGGGGTPQNAKSDDASRLWNDHQRNGNRDPESNRAAEKQQQQQIQQSTESTRAVLSLYNLSVWPLPDDRRRHRRLSERTRGLHSAPSDHQHTEFKLIHQRSSYPDDPVFRKILGGSSGASGYYSDSRLTRSTSRRPPLMMPRLPPGFLSQSIQLSNSSDDVGLSVTAAGDDKVRGPRRVSVTALFEKSITKLNPSWRNDVSGRRPFVRSRTLPFQSDHVPFHYTRTPTNSPTNVDDANSAYMNFTSRISPREVPASARRSAGWKWLTEQDRLEYGGDDPIGRLRASGEGGDERPGMGRQPRQITVVIPY